jgi:hypothetical protein
LDNQAFDGADDCPWKKGTISVERVATAHLPTQTGDFKIAGYRSLNSPSSGYIRSV